MNEVFTEKKKGYLDTGINVRSLKTMYLTILPEQRCIKYKEVEIPMTRSEFDVLLYFAGQPGRVFTNLMSFILWQLIKAVFLQKIKSFRLPDQKIHRMRIMRSGV